MKRIGCLLLFVLRLASGQTYHMDCHKDNGGKGISLKVTCSAPMNRFYLYQWEFNSNIIDSVILATPATEVTFDCLYAGNYGVRSVLHQGTWTAATTFQVCWTMSGKISVVQPQAFYISAWPITSSCSDNDGEIRMKTARGGVGDITYILKNQQGETIQEITDGRNRLTYFKDLTGGTYLTEARDANGCYNSFPLELAVETGNGAVTVDIIDKAGTCARDDGYIIARARSKTDESYDVYTYSLLQNGEQIGWENISGIFGGLSEGTYQIRALNQVSHCESTTQPLQVSAEESMDVIINTEIP